LADLPSGGAYDSVNVLQGSAFMLSDLAGDVHAESPAGLFYEDTRYLNRFMLTVDGLTPVVLSAANADYNAAAFFLTNPELDGVPAESISIQRYRSVDEDTNEVLLVQSHLNEEIAVTIRLGCGTDFADLFEVKSMNIVKTGTLSTSHDGERGLLFFEYQHADFHAATRIHSSEPPTLDGDDFVFALRLPPRGSWKTRIQITFRPGEAEQPLIVQDREASRVLSAWREAEHVKKWREEAPQLEADWDLLKLVYEKSVVDLAALRLHANVEGNDFSLPAAGLPWFMAIFGRDTLITAYQSLLVGPELARGALFALAGLQGTEVNDFKDEEPGKILHEIRFGELTVLGEKPHRPYYGTADATPLFLVLLSEYWRLTGDAATVEALRENALRALAWIDEHGDRDGDGYVEYETRSSQGLENQGWKDSWNGVVFADGTLPGPPIAMCEVQGYVFDAKSRAAELAEEAWGDAELAESLRAQAGELRERFNEDFWVEERGGFYAVALDGEKQRVDSLTSNVGHLLWSGIVAEERAEEIVARLFSPPMWTGWGIRTLSADDVAYNPIGYHIGTVWPHDNALIAAGLYRYGFREQANRIAAAMVEAAGYTDFRLPEVFAGYPRADSRVPVRYPTASSPQAWATSAPFLWLRLMLGIEVVDGELRADPVIPSKCGRVALRGVHALGRRVDVHGDGTIVDVGAAVAPPPAPRSV
jgi:glycogen debranching enzyme